MKSSARVFKRCRPLLGTFVEISLLESEARSCEKAFHKAFAVIENISNTMSFHDPASELSAFNRRAVGKWAAVTHDMATVLKFSLTLQHRSHGVFNIAVGRPLMHWKFLPGKASGAGFSVLNRPGFELRRTKKQYEARRVLPVKIDLGGVAKGYAVDQAVKVLKKSGLKAGCVNAGGDMRVFGESSQGVFIRSLNDPERGHLTSLLDSSLAASEVIQKKKRSPYVDVRRRKPLLNNAMAIVTAKTCVVADALTKIALLAPPELAQQIALRYKAEMKAVL